MSTVREEIAKNLLFYRKKFGYTQKELAALLGVKNSAISNWENGQNSIDIETLFRACEVFHITLNDIYGKYSSVDYYSPHEKNVLSAYRNNPEMQAAVDKLLGIVDDTPTVIEDIAETITKSLGKNIVSK